MTDLPDPIDQAAYYHNVNLKRLIAWFIDAVAITFIAILISVLTFGIGFFMFAGIWFIVGFFYRFPGLTIHSSTMGMRMTGIEFRQRHDRPFDGLYALLHTAGTMMAYATSLQPVSVILMLITFRKQGLVDLILATVVVNRAARRSSN
ncbi:hypothetical protein IMCC1933_11080 [Rhodobacteraceae bacterium IMCC1933]|nr:hypothetical protein [Rhodobacteraceae bacterium IMCC1923]MDP4067564.1 hypothetical protein [Rhodobacteraceae bacterium IMCC1933]MDP4070765.1 hypothetical protein [Rhodobacteraceae bacterium IMCC1909]